MKKIICALLAAALLLCGLCLAEPYTDLDAANARITELEALVELYKPFYDKEIVATYGANGVLWLDDVKGDYEAMCQMYAQYGIDPEAYGLTEGIKQDVVESRIENIILLNKGHELGLDVFTEEQEQALADEAAVTMEDNINSYIGYYYSEAEEITPEMRAEAEDYFASINVDAESIAAELRETDIVDSVYSYVTDGLTVTDQDLENTYKALIEKNKSDYASDYTYCADRNAGVAIAWNPEGYRAVKQVLIGFDDDQQSRYDDLTSQIASLESEKAGTESDADTGIADGGEEPAEEEPAVRRPDAEIDADIAACNAELEALYAELQPKVDEVVNAFAAGTPIEELIANYNSDPGMSEGVTAEIGYPVCENSETWDPAFTQAAMSIAEPGQLSEPARGSYGVYIVYYLSDIPAGEVALDEIKDSLRQDALSEKINTTYADRLDAWKTEADVVYHLENFV